jgi:hypothetical protein
MDLTKITTPFGLLDEATQKALRECGGPWQCVSDFGWTELPHASFLPRLTYRQKPQPPKPREITLFEYEDGTASSVMLSMRGMFTAKTKWREVIE